MSDPRLKDSLDVFRVSAKGSLIQLKQMEAREGTDESPCHTEPIMGPSRRVYLQALDHHARVFLNIITKDGLWFGPRTCEVVLLSNRAVIRAIADCHPNTELILHALLIYIAENDDETDIPLPNIELDSTLRTNIYNDAVTLATTPSTPPVAVPYFYPYDFTTSRGEDYEEYATNIAHLLHTATHATTV